MQRAGVLTDVRPPTPREEAVRDLARARDDARDDLQRGRQRLGKFLLRHGLPYAGKHWTRGHRAWVAGLAWEHQAEQQVVDDYLLAIDHLETRLGELDAQLAEHAASKPYRTAVGALRCFHGIDTLTAMLILAELHDFRRFPSPRALMASLGLVPGEASIGPCRAEQCSFGLPLPGLGPAPSGGLTTNSRRTGVRPSSAVRSSIG